MVTIAFLTFVLLRRLGASRIGGVIGSSVFFTAPSAAAGWFHLTMAEPVGAGVAIAMAVRATRYQASVSYLRESSFLAIGSILLLMTKELLAPLLLLPVGVALLVQSDGRIGSPRVSRRNAALLIAVGAACFVALVPIAWTYFRAESSAYAALYGQGLQSPLTVLAIWLTVLVPFELFPAPVNAAWAASLVSLIGLLSLGWRLHLVNGNEVGGRWLLGLGLGVPLLGVIAYAPLVWYAVFYSLPYLVGPAILLAMAVTGVEAHLPAGKWLAVCSWLAMCVYGASTAQANAAYRDAVQKRDDAIVSFVADSAEADSVLFATDRPPPAEWQEHSSPEDAPRGLGATYNRYARATHRAWAPTRDGGCDQVSVVQAASHRVTIVNLESSCELGAGTRRIIVHFNRLDWRSFRVVEDSVHADILTQGPLAPSR
jgi:hypothetical protein